MVNFPGITHALHSSVAVLSLRPRLDALCAPAGLPLSGLFRPFLAAAELLLSESEAAFSECSFGAKFKFEFEPDGCGSSADCFCCLAALPLATSCAPVAVVMELATTGDWTRPGLWFGAKFKLAEGVGLSVDGLGAMGALRDGWRG